MKGKTVFLISELDSDVQVLEELYEKNRLISKKIENSIPDEFDWAALGYTIHILYNLMENYFFRIAKFFFKAHNIYREKLTLISP